MTEDEVFRIDVQLGDSDLLNFENESDKIVGQNLRV